MLLDLTCPVENRAAIVKTKSETNEPYLLLKLFNLSEKTISDVTLRVLAYDANGTELGVLPVEFSDVNGAPKTFFAENKAISLETLENAKHFVVQFDSVKFDDGTEYAFSEENLVEVDEENAPVEEALLLRNFVPEAVCYASRRNGYWKCVCGRANKPEDETCVRCGNSLDEMLTKFSSKETLSEAIENAKLAEEERRIDEEKKKAEDKVKKINTLKKGALIALISALILGILSVAGVFTYRAVLNNKADKAFENGDYLNAYELYKKTGNKKISELTDVLQGNTPENLVFGNGLITEDDVFLYYVAQNPQTYAFELVKENKKTNEKVMLTDAGGGALNVSGDWIYFIDFQTGYIKRISKDGKKLETVLEKSVSYLSVIGSTIYYLQTDYDNPNNLSEEQCQVLAEQGQMKTFLHLYQMDADKKEPKILLEENIDSCYISGGRIYYLTGNDEVSADGNVNWDAYLLCSVDLNGKNKKQVVDSPVATFLLKENTLYYVELFDHTKKGEDVTEQEALSYTLVEKNLTNGAERPLAEDYMVYYINQNDDTLFMIANSRSEYEAYVGGDSETQFSINLYTMDFQSKNIKTLIVGDVQIFNVCGEDVLAYISYQGMCRVKADGTGFDVVESVNPAFAKSEEENVETQEPETK